MSPYRGRIVARRAATSIVGLIIAAAVGLPGIPSALADEAGRAPPGLSCPDRRASVALSGWDIVEGDPQGDVILAPDTSRRQAGVFINRWELRAYAAEGLFLRCEYGGSSSDRLILPMARDVKACEARGRAGKDGNVTIPMKVRCR
jgi:hypothetical protein